jgi:plasmid stabilization system protein ParE
MAEDKPPMLWSPEALADIDQMWDYYAEVTGRSIADKVLREIAGVVLTVRDFPMAGRSRDEVRQDFARFPQVRISYFIGSSTVGLKSYGCSTGDRISTRFSPERRVFDLVAGRTSRMSALIQ